MKTPRETGKTETKTEQQREMGRDDENRAHQKNISCFAVGLAAKGEQKQTL